MGDLHRDAYDSQTAHSIVSVQPSKPFYKRGWFWGCLVASLIILALAGNQNTPSSTEQVMQSCQQRYTMTDNQQRCELEGLTKLRESL